MSEPAVHRYDYAGRRSYKVRLADAPVVDVVRDGFQRGHFTADGYKSGHPIEWRLRFRVTLVIVLELPDGREMPILYGYRERRKDGVSFGYEHPLPCGRIESV